MATIAFAPRSPHDIHGENAVPSSSPAFGTPVHPPQPLRPPNHPQASILPIVLSPATLRPLAFRIFTKKHDLNLTTAALRILSTFVGKHCGSGWRQEGLAELLLDETAKQWKKKGGPVLVPGEDGVLEQVLNLANSAITQSRQKRQSKEFDSRPPTQRDDTFSHSLVTAQHLQNGRETRDVDEDVTACDQTSTDPRSWLQVVNTYRQPQLLYNPTRKQFEVATSPRSLLPPTSQKITAFRQRYHLVHQRLMRNESFQTSAIRSSHVRSSKSPGLSIATIQKAYKLTPIANLLGRGGTVHVLLGMLARSPSGHLTINDPSGSILLDLQYAHPPPDEGIWLTPGMMVVVEGHYEDSESSAAVCLDGNSGVGGTISGVFIAFAITGPPSESREITLGLRKDSLSDQPISTAGFGWVDFLGVGSDKASGQSMRDIEKRILGAGQRHDSSDGRSRIVILGEVNLDVSNTLHALQRVLTIYAAEPVDETPMAVVLMGNFVRHAGMAGLGSEGSIEYKESFDSLASVLSEFSTLLQRTTFIFVPGDNDPWASSFSAGASSLIPHDPIPEIFTSRIRRVFTNANNDSERVMGSKCPGEAVWSTNPTRLSLFGPGLEIVLFRDDISARFRRNAIPLASSTSNHEAALSHAAPSDTGDTQDFEDGAALGLAPQDSHHSRAAVDGTTSSSTKSSETAIARRLVKTVIDQAHLSPFDWSKRPIRCDQAGSLHLYPLPTAMVLMDPEAPQFALGLDGCHVMNPGSLIVPNKKNTMQWIEYSIKSRKGRLKSARI